MSTPLHPTRPGTQHELTTLLASTIGADVEAAMNSVDWAHTTQAPVAPPANPEEQVTPAVTTPTEGLASPAQPASTTEINWDEFKDPQTGLYAGKYRDPSALVKGMHSLLHMTKEAQARADQLAQENEQLRRPPVVEQTPEPVIRSEKLETILAKAKESGSLDTDDLHQLIEGIAENAELVARGAVQKQTQEVTKEQLEWANVDQYMTEKHKDSLNFVDEMTVFKSQDPVVRSIYDRFLATNDEASKRDATVYLWNEFSRANPHVLGAPVDAAAQVQEQKLQANAQVRKEEVEQARKDAGLLGTQAAGVHEASQQAGVSQADIDVAARLMKQTGMGQLWRSMTIAKDLNHPLFDE